MKNLLKAEFYYLIKNIRFYVFLGLIAAGNISGIIFNNSLLPAIANLAVFVFAAILLLEFSHKDFNNKTMKNYVGCGKTLFQVYFAKLLICLLAVFALIAVQKIFGTWAEIYTGVKTIEEYSAFTIIASIIINLLQCSVVFCICSLIPSGAISIIVSLLYVVIFPVAKDFIKNDIFDAINPFLLDTIGNDIYGQSVNGLEVAQTTAATLSGDLVLHFAVALVVVAAINVLGAYVYSKREVK